MFSRPFLEMWYEKTIFITNAAFFDYFVTQRQHGARSVNPDANQAGYAIQHLTVRKMIKKVKGGNTTFGASNAWQELCDEPLPKRVKVTKKGQQTTIQHTSSDNENVSTHLS